ncbi:MAG: YfcE family phosphodiesterase [Bacteroidota bacterium]
MKIAIISDIHDHVQNLKKALALPQLQNTEALLCCGDLCSPFMIRLLAQGYPQPIHTVLGNNDGDVASFIQVSKSFLHFQIHGEFFRGDLGGISIAANHYPEKAKALAQNGGYDVVCYGHNHTLAHDEIIGNTLYMNPGAIMGFHGGHLTEIPATFLILDTITLEVEVHSI